MRGCSREPRGSVSRVLTLHQLRAWGLQRLALHPGCSRPLSLASDSLSRLPVPPLSSLRFPFTMTPSLHLQLPNLPTAKPAFLCRKACGFMISNIDAHFGGLCYVSGLELHAHRRVQSSE